MPTYNPFPRLLPAMTSSGLAALPAIQTESALAPATPDPYAALMQKLLAPAMPVAATTMPDFGKLLNPPQRHLAMSGMEINPDGSDPANPFTNGFFKTEAQRNATIAEHNAAVPGGSYGPVGPAMSTPSPYLQSAPLLQPGQQVLQPYSTTGRVPRINFGSIIRPM